MSLMSYEFNELSEFNGFNGFNEFNELSEFNGFNELILAPFLKAFALTGRDCSNA